MFLQVTAPFLILVSVTALLLSCGGPTLWLGIVTAA